MYVQCIHTGEWYDSRTGQYVYLVLVPGTLTVVLYHSQFRTCTVIPVPEGDPGMGTGTAKLYRMFENNVQVGIGNAISSTNSWPIF